MWAVIIVALVAWAVGFVLTWAMFAGRSVPNVTEQEEAMGEGSDEVG
jgi:hypothetical protein